jgi:hypothetical protein
MTYLMSGLSVCAGGNRRLVHDRLPSQHRREVQCGHKINLATGRSGLIPDVVVEAGNPADADRFLPILERHIACHGQPPRQIASDVAMPVLPTSPRPKVLGVSDITFHKKGHLGMGALHVLRLVLGCRLQPGSLCATSLSRAPTAAPCGHPKRRSHRRYGTRQGCNCNYSLTEAGNRRPRDRSERRPGRSEGSSSGKNPVYGRALASCPPNTD